MNFVRKVLFVVEDPREVAQRNVDGGPVVVKGMGREDVDENELSCTHGEGGSPGGFKGDRSGLSGGANGEDGKAGLVGGLGGGLSLEEQPFVRSGGSEPAYSLAVIDGVVEPGPVLSMVGAVTDRQVGSKGNSIKLDGWLDSVKFNVLDVLAIFGRVRKENDLGGG